MVTLIIVVVTVLFSLMGFNNRTLFTNFLFDPYLVAHKKQHYRIFTHAFLHGGWPHLLINMFVLYQFGGAVENSFHVLFGSKGLWYFLTLYFGGILASSLPTLKKEANNPYYKSIGASGAVSAVLFSYIVMFPTNMLGVMIVIPIPAIIFGVLYLWYEKRMALQNQNDGIGHDAHYYGAVYGALVTVVFKPQLAIDFASKIIGVFM